MSAQATTTTPRRTADDELRAERVSRYKEERRRQLAAHAATRTQNASSQGIAHSAQQTGSPRRFISRAKSSTPNPPVPPSPGDASSGSDGVAVRTTRASRLRAARLSDNTANKRLSVATNPTVTPDANKARSPLPLPSASEATCGGIRNSRLEKDKSSKRKSNLNRSLNTEEVPISDPNDDSLTTRRRRRRVLNPNDILISLNESGASSGSNNTSARVTPLPSPSSGSSQNNHNNISPRSTASTPRRSELSIHMENARKIGHSSSDSPKARSNVTSSDGGKNKQSTMSNSWDGSGTKSNTTRTNTVFNSKRVFTSSPRQQKVESDRVSKKSTGSEIEEYYSLSDKDFRSRRSAASSSDEKTLRNKLDKSTRVVMSDSERAVRKTLSDRKNQVTSASKKTSDISKRMDELTAFTRETLARVERLTNRTVQSPRREVLDRKKSVSKSPEKVINKPQLAKSALTNQVQSNISSKNINNSVQHIVDPEEEQNQNGFHDDSSKPSSILKKKSNLDSPSNTNVVVNVLPSSVLLHGPVSILKRKSSQDEAGPVLTTPPVTFSPTVVDPVPNRKKPGILKKRCSLDESHVRRRRSYSPDVALVENLNDYRPILKTQRRSSLEEIIRTHSPDLQHPQGILKRKHSRGEDEFNQRSLGSPEPQSILKRKSGTSSSGSSGNSPHVSIATAVILAAAGGAEIILEPSETVKPILKKKSFSDENPCMDSLNPEVPKPILKKKSSTETDDQDDRPMKPILKSSRKCSTDDNYSSRESNDYGIDSPRYYSVLRNRSNHNSGESGSECETAMRPILKQSSSRENSPRPRLSFCNDDNDNLLNRSTSPDANTRRSKFVRRSNTVADTDLNSILNIRRSYDGKDFSQVDETSKDEPHIPKRPVSVFELVMNFEKTQDTSQGAIPKRSSMKGSRNSGRFRTQPITFDELEATQSLDSIQSFQAQPTPAPETLPSPARLSLGLDCQQSPSGQRGDSSSADLSHSLDLSTISSSNNDSQLTTPSSIPNESADSGVASKMSFVQEDEREELSPQELCRSNSVSAKASMFKQLEEQMKAVAEEAKAVRLSKGGNRGVQRYRNRKQATTTNSENRFSTQPVTLDEVQEAVLANQRAVVESADSENVSTEPVQPQASSDEADPSKLSLAERVKLFNQKITHERLPIAGGVPPASGGILRKPRHARFKTQPVTNEEMESVQKISPLAASLVKPPNADTLAGLSIRATKDKIYEHAAKMLTNEVRGILKSKSAISPIPTSSSSSETAPNILKESSFATNGHKHDSEDEGVSTEETSSGSDSLTRDKPTIKSVNKNGSKNRDRDSSNEKENNREDNIEAVNNKKNRDMSDNIKLKVDECMKELEVRNKIRRHLEEVQQMSSSEGTPQTSDGESSGGREVKRIISNDAVARRRHAAIYRQKEKNNPSLVKSKSQSSLGREAPISRPLLLALPTGGGDRAPYEGLSRGGVRRSLTLPLRPPSTEGRRRVSKDDEEFADDMPGGGTIADRLAELQNSGNNEWRKRLPKLNTANDELNQINNIVSKNIYNDSLSVDNALEKTSILAARKDKLETASQQWKKRVEVSDALTFSVAGRMTQEAKDLSLSPLTVTAPADKKKRTPKPTRFRGREGDSKPPSSTPVSPEKICKIKFTRSISAPGVGDDDGYSDLEVPVAKTEGRRVVVPRPDDETFTTFFESVTKSQSHHEHLQVTKDDLDSVTRQSGDLLVTKRTVRVQRKHAGTTRNPIKALAARSDILEEYTEVITGVAEREKRRINVEKLAKHSSMAIEALAGLASKEDFTAISLKKNTTGANSALLPYKDLMLLHIKGRRHVQTRLVEPVASSLNKGDNFVLVTPAQVFNYVGPFSNIIEQSRGAEIAQHILQKKDLGCKTLEVITIHEGKAKCTRSQMETFWKLLGSSADQIITEAGHPDEDEIYESAMIDTNMIYELDNNELVPVEAYWGSIPKIEMLDSSKVLVFDFGSELYIWSGRNVPIEQRRDGARLAKELWESGYNYSDCTICPVNAVTFLGGRKNTQLDKTSQFRPEWALLCKITQHGETILFREKFLDWPDFSRVIKVKDNNEKTIDGSIVVKPCDAQIMRKSEPVYPDLVLEGSHLGRGIEYFDEETNRHFEIATMAIKTWHISEYEYEELPEESSGQFYDGDSYVIRWQYMLTVTGRELSGKPSKHSVIGRDRCAYFCWQGRKAPLNDKGAAALLTVELDHERGPQQRIIQENEPPAFLNLFDGRMTIHNGRRESKDDQKPSEKLYLCRGDSENEAHLLEVPCSMRQLRSRASFLLNNSDSGSIIVWHGSKTLKHTREIALSVAEKIKSSPPSECNFSRNIARIQETEEGSENPEFQAALSCTNRQFYFSLLKNPHTFEHTPRIFHLTSISGVFSATELFCSHLSEETTAYPFIQHELYSASQPALFLIDNDYELWLWQGWWPEMDSDSDSDNSERGYADQTGSGQHRWQAERRAAMQTVLDYWQGPRDKGVPAFLVWAGLEPLEFTSLFPTWSDRDDIAELNIRDGRKPGEILRVENELARLTQSTYPLIQLLQRPLPDGVDPTHLEDYLSGDDFITFLGMTIPEFQKLPIWKQTNIKKEKGLF